MIASTVYFAKSDLFNILQQRCPYLMRRVTQIDSYDPVTTSGHMYRLYQGERHITVIHVAATLMQTNPIEIFERMNESMRPKEAKELHHRCEKPNTI